MLLKDRWQGGCYGSEGGKPASTVDWAAFLDNPSSPDGLIAALLLPRLMPPE